MEETITIKRTVQGQEEKFPLTYEELKAAHNLYEQKVKANAVAAFIINDIQKETDVDAKTILGQDPYTWAMKHMDEITINNINVIDQDFMQSIWKALDEDPDVEKNLISMVILAAKTGNLHIGHANMELYQYGSSKPIEDIMFLKCGQALDETTITKILKLKNIGIHAKLQFVTRTVYGEYKTDISVDTYTTNMAYKQDPDDETVLQLQIRSPFKDADEFVKANIRAALAAYIRKCEKTETLLAANDMELLQQIPTDIYNDYHIKSISYRRINVQNWNEMPIHDIKTMIQQGHIKLLDEIKTQCPLAKKSGIRPAGYTTCDGFAKSPTNDEPCDQCMDCILNTFHETNE